CTPRGAPVARESRATRVEVGEALGEVRDDGLVGLGEVGPRLGRACSASSMSSGSTTRSISRSWPHDLVLGRVDDPAGEAGAVLGGEVEKRRYDGLGRLPAGPVVVLAQLVDGHLGLHGAGPERIHR